MSPCYFICHTSGYVLRKTIERKNVRAINLFTSTSCYLSLSIAAATATFFYISMLRLSEITIFFNIRRIFTPLLPHHCTKPFRHICSQLSLSLNSDQRLDGLRVINGKCTLCLKCFCCIYSDLFPLSDSRNVITRTGTFIRKK